MYIVDLLCWNFSTFKKQENINKFNIKSQSFLAQVLQYFSANFTILKLNFPPYQLYSGYRYLTYRILL